MGLMGFQVQSLNDTHASRYLQSNPTSETLNLSPETQNPNSSN